MIADLLAAIKIAIFYSISERQCAAWTTIIKFQPSRGTIFHFLPHFISRTAGPIISNFLYDVEALV